jgi:hypothetical protein
LVVALDFGINMKCPNSITFWKVATECEVRERIGCAGVEVGGAGEVNQRVAEGARRKKSTYWTTH